MQAANARDVQPSFLGYVRADGSVGVRNHLLVLSTGGMTGQTARRIAAAIAGAVVVTLPYGGGLLGQDKDLHASAIHRFATHPNVGGALLIGDNPEVMRAALAAIAGSGRPHMGLTLDECGHDALTLTDRGLRAGAILAMRISAERRTAVPVSVLGLGLECGRSDPSSGLVANPLLGLISDWLVDAGGRTMIGETMEWLGAEHLLASRARTPKIAEAVGAAVVFREQMAVAAGIDLTGSNPTPTNIAAGLSSIEEKSLGNIAKSGSRPIEGVLDYGEPPGGSGVWTMDGAAYSPESVTGFVLAGAQMMLFTTGVGNSYVSALCPTLKITANPRTGSALHQQIDFDASPVFSGAASLETSAEALKACILAVASGTTTWGEILGEGDEVLSRFAAAL